MGEEVKSEPVGAASVVCTLDGSLLKVSWEQAALDSAGEASVDMGGYGLLRARDAGKKPSPAAAL